MGVKKALGIGVLILGLLLLAGGALLKEDEDLEDMTL